MCYIFCLYGNFAIKYFVMSRGWCPVWFFFLSMFSQRCSNALQERFPVELRFLSFYLEGVQTHFILRNGVRFSTQDNIYFYQISGKRLSEGCLAVKIARFLYLTAWPHKTVESYLCSQTSEIYALLASYCWVINCDGFRRSLLHFNECVNLESEWKPQ